MRIGLIVLAAGKSTRTGALGQKALLPWPKEPGSLLGVVLENFQDAHPWEQALVVHNDSSPSLDRIVKDAGSPFEALKNTSQPALMSDSLRLGVEALTENIDGVLIALGDMPFIRKPHIQKILYSCGSDRIVQPRIGNKPGNPVFFSREFFGPLRLAQKDQGGRAVIKEHASKLTVVSFSDALAFRDIDTAEDYAQAIEEATRDGC